MKLTELVKGIAAGPVPDLAVGEVRDDSRAVSPGDVFVAVRGTEVDGHDFAAAAVENGAVAVVTEISMDLGAVNIVVENASKALAVMSARSMGNPADRLRLCGVTGTNGKTSVAHIIREIMKCAGRPMGIIGTVGHGVGELVRTEHTTPGAPTIHRLLREMLDEGVYGVVMEVSSHAVRQHRTWGMDFEVGILTNVTHDHLDYHADMDDYRQAKAEFCQSLNAPHRGKPDGTLVYFVDDEVAGRIGNAFAGNKVAVGTRDDADVRISNVSTTLDATTLTIHFPEGDATARMQLLGGFVPDNAAMAAVGAKALGVKISDIVAGLESISRVPGRFEAIGGAGRPVVIIDYAHTADSVRRVLDTCRALRPRRITTVFGCGGDRDRGKRPLIGDAVQRLSDESIVTTDNPRTEDVDRIISDILAGMSSRDGVHVEKDRVTAVEMAIEGSIEGDVVVLLGKGHEDYQIVGREKLPYSDREVAEGALRRWSAQ